ncbi:MAG: hypothetical protein BGO65_09435 [Afipia sp. 64-13]|nr:MAG: hypothetical protein BGO65_09435 [Afipia sp. 64-13]
MAYSVACDPHLGGPASIDWDGWEKSAAEAGHSGVGADRSFVEFDLNEATQHQRGDHAYRVMPMTDGLQAGRKRHGAMVFEKGQNPESITKGYSVGGILQKITGVLEPDVAAQAGFVMCFVTVAELLSGITCPLRRNGSSRGGDRVDEMGACCARDGEIGYVPSIPVAQHQRQTGPGNDGRIEIEEAADIPSQRRPKHRKANASDRTSGCKREGRRVGPDAG